MAAFTSSSWAELTRLVSWHRRKLAVIAAMSAAALGITAAAPDPAPTSTVVVADHRLAGGVQLTADDLSRRQLPTSAVPAGAIADADRLVGRTLIAPLTQGSVLTELSVLGDRPVVADGHTLAPVRVSDPGVVALLRPGDRVDVVASVPESGEGAQLIAEGVRVVTIPASDEAGGGLDPGTGDPRTLILLDVSRDQATVLADAAATSQLSLLLSP